MKTGMLAASEADRWRNIAWLLKNSFMLEPAEIKSRWDAL
jgi:hypothetical protein